MKMLFKIIITLIAYNYIAFAQEIPKVSYKSFNSYEKFLIDKIQNQKTDLDKFDELIRHANEEALTKDMLDYLFNNKKIKNLFVENKFLFSYLRNRKRERFPTLLFKYWITNDFGKSILVAKDKYFKNLFHYLAVDGKLTNEMFNELIKTDWGRNVLTAKDRVGNTLIYYLASSGELTNEMFNALTATEWGKDVLTIKDKYSKNLIHYLAWNDKLTPEMFNALTAKEWGKDVLTAKDADDRTPIHYIEIRGKYTAEMFNALIATDWGKDVLAAKDITDKTPIHYLASRDKLTPEMFTTLIATEWGKDALAAKDKDDITPIYFIAVNDKFTNEMFNALITKEWGKDVLSAKDKDNKTLIHNLAWIEKLTPEMFTTLVTKEWGKDILANKDNYDRTPIHYLALNEQLTPEMFNTLIATEWGKDILANKDESIKTPIHYLASSDKLTPEMFTTLVTTDWGKDILAAKDLYEQTPINFLASRGKLTAEMFNALIATEQGRTVLIAKNKDEKTPIHYLVSSGMLTNEFLERLLLDQKFLKAILQSDNNNETIFEQLKFVSLFELFNKMYTEDKNLYTIFLKLAEENIKNEQLKKDIIYFSKHIPIKINNDIYKNLSKENTEIVKLINDESFSSDLYKKAYLQYHLSQDTMQRESSIKELNLQAHELHKKLALSIIKEQPKVFIPYFIDLLKTKSTINNSHKDLISKVLSHSKENDLIKLSDIIEILQHSPQFFVKETVLKFLQTIEMNSDEADLFKNYIASIDDKKLKQIASKTYNGQKIAKYEVLKSTIKRIEKLAFSKMDSSKIDDQFFTLSNDFIEGLVSMEKAQRNKFQPYIDDEVKRLNDQINGLSSNDKAKELLKDLVKLLKNDQAMINAVIDINRTH